MFKALLFCNLSLIGLGIAYHLLKIWNWKSIFMLVDALILASFIIFLDVFGFPFYILLRPLSWCGVVWMIVMVAMVFNWCIVWQKLHKYCQLFVFWFIWIDSSGLLLGFEHNLVSEIIRKTNTHSKLNLYYWPENLGRCGSSKTNWFRRVDSRSRANMDITIVQNCLKLNFGEFEIE